VKHEFVEQIPERLNDGVLYVSMSFGTVVHKCACGCGSEVVTPLSPTDWKLTFDGESISLHPSIGNWSFACRSHYWITNGQVGGHRSGWRRRSPKVMHSTANKARLGHPHSQEAELPTAQAKQTHGKSSSMPTYEPPPRAGVWAAIGRWWFGH
jgi:hypothetical protein